MRKGVGEDRKGCGGCVRVCVVVGVCVGGVGDDG